MESGVLSHKLSLPTLPHAKYTWAYYYKKINLWLNKFNLLFSGLHCRVLAIELEQAFVLCTM